jgi:hypothetical protein
VTTCCCCAPSVEHRGSPSIHPAGHRGALFERARGPPQSQFVRFGRRRKLHSAVISRAKSSRRYVKAGANVRAKFVTEHSENNYPPLPVREGEEVFVWLSLFADERARDAHLGRIDLQALTAEHLAARPETHRLQTTSRSLLPD